MRLIRGVKGIRRLASFALVSALASALAACQATAPIAPAPRIGPVVSPPVSESSAGLAQYYNRVQNDLLAQGLLRQDGGGPDTAFSADNLARNFEQIAFFDEYARGAGLQASSGNAGALRRWSGPVRIGVEFGDSVPLRQRLRDKATVQSYSSRLARLTGHPISTVNGNANFHVMILSETDRPSAVARVKQLVPNISSTTLELVRNIPRSIHCMVIAFSAQDNDSDYKTAIALIRSEHPDLLRRSCIHEEVAQGLGLANDSPAARPSIFNDDDEFALLTTHDEMLLGMLYDPRLSIGMPAAQARLIIRQMAAERVGANY